MAFFVLISIIIIVFISTVLYLLEKTEKVDSREAEKTSVNEARHAQNLDYLREKLNTMNEDTYYMIVESLVKLHKKVEDLERTYKRDH